MGEVSWSKEICRRLAKNFADGTRLENVCSLKEPIFTHNVVNWYYKSFILGIKSGECYAKIRTFGHAPNDRYLANSYSMWAATFPNRVVVGFRLSPPDHSVHPISGLHLV